MRARAKDGSGSHKRKFEDVAEGSESYVKKFEVNTTLTNLVAKTEGKKHPEHLYEGFLSDRTAFQPCMKIRGPPYRSQELRKVKFDVLSEHGLQRSSIKSDLPSDGARNILTFLLGG